MKLNFLEDDPKSIVVEFVDADRSIPEMIKSKLIDNKDVEFVGVVKEHPDIAKAKAHSEVHEERAHAGSKGGG